MTLLAGVFSRTGRLRLPEEALVMLRSAVSRNLADTPITSRSEGAFLLKLDIDAFGEPAMHEENGSITLLAGEPIVLRHSATTRGRIHDAAVLHRALREGREELLRETRGTFSLAHLDAHKGRLLLATDKLGVRPMYWWADDDTVAFSSTLRLLEALPWVTKELDQRGLAELMAFGFPMARRTPYLNISLLEPGELVEFTVSDTARREYWRWQDVAESREDLAALGRRAHAEFAAGIRLRQRGDRYATAFLSGGLDSRCVVAALRADGVDVHSFNFASNGSEDRVYGAALAQAAGTTHEELEMPNAVTVHWSEMIARARAASTCDIKARVERPMLYWSGDGGSVGMGHVYIRPPIVERCVAGDLYGAADAYVASERATVPRRLLTTEAAASMAEAPRRGVIEELIRLQTADLLQTFYLMLLHNDQHRHLHQHFEDIDLHRVELQLPFFDAAFLAVIASVPIEARLYHRFYTQWLAHFPAYVQRTNWQAYPGHVPCPLPRPEGLSYQWDARVTALRRAQDRWNTLRTARKCLFARDFPSLLMRRRSLAAVSLIQLLGLKNLDYVIHSAAIIVRYWSVYRRSVSAKRTGSVGT